MHLENKTLNQCHFCSVAVTAGPPPPPTPACTAKLLADCAPEQKLGKTACTMCVASDKQNLTSGACERHTCPVPVCLLFLRLLCSALPFLLPFCLPGLLC